MGNTLFYMSLHNGECRNAESVDHGIKQVPIHVHTRRLAKDLNCTMCEFQ
eukprot:COSAG02_NODE_55_length_43887_cov_30.660364_31_plen_50_part_00